MDLEPLQRFFAESPINASAFSESLWLIIALPLFGAFLCGVFGRWLGRANVHLVACSSVAGSLCLSILAFWVTVDPRTQYNPGGFIRQFATGFDFGRWFGAGSFVVNYGLSVDHLTGCMLLVITGVGLLIHIYSTEYMSHDEGYARYFAYLNLFVAMMLTLVLGDNLVLTFVGWEGVGLCSYLLIGFWYSDAAKAFAGRKAFITNRIGDFAFVIGMLLLVLWVGAFQKQTGPSTARALGFATAQVGPLSYAVLEHVSQNLQAGAPKVDVGLDTEILDGPLTGYTFGAVLTCILLLFLLGAAGKSAQLPLYVWLPDAMAGPTPVSALIHAATMVTAGVYLFCRLSFLLVFSPVAMATIAIVGGLTALLAALIAFAQDDIKKVLAYSTVSQLGFMFMAAGMGVFWAATLHLVTHAFFKACLFLGAGSVMHGNGDETDIKKLGGLRHEMPWTWLTFAIATAAITGILPFSGFFSKDAILHGIHATTLQGLPWVSPLVWTLGLLSAACTAFYMTRLYILTFEGQRSKDAKVPHAHESAWPMTVPLVLLAGLSIIAISHGVPALRSPEGGYETLMQNFLTPVLHPAHQVAQRIGSLHEEAFEWGSLFGAYGLAFLIALMATGAAGFFYLRYLPEHRGQPAPSWARAMQRLAMNKFYVDEIYEALVIRPIKLVSFVLFKVVDTFLIDTVAVRGSAWVTSWTASVMRYFQTGDAQTYATAIAVGALGVLVYALSLVLK